MEHFGQNKPGYYYNGREECCNETGCGKYYAPKYTRYYEKTEEKPVYYGSYEKTPQYYQQEKPELGYSKNIEEKPVYYGSWEKTPQYYQQEKPEWGYGKNTEEKPGYYYGSYEKHLEGRGRNYYQNKPQYSIERVQGDWEKVCEKLERTYLVDKCCDEETVKQIKELITILIGAEQSYIQLGFLCMDEKFTLVNTSEYFRLCGLRLRWLANGLIRRSVRLFNVNEWINTTHFENWFKVPTKEELTANNYTSIIKTLFKVVIDGERRISERMDVLAEKLNKVDWMNSECKFEGGKWLMNFVLPYQTHFLREITAHFNNIEMCDNGYIFDKCEMRPFVKTIEEFIHKLGKNNTWNVKVISEKRFW